jgi:hypothetical protein
MTRRVVQVQKLGLQWLIPPDLIVALARWRGWIETEPRDGQDT